MSKIEKVPEINRMARDIASLLGDSVKYVISETPTKNCGQAVSFYYIDYPSIGDLSEEENKELGKESNYIGTLFLAQYPYNLEV